MVMTEQQEKLQVCENNWVRRIAGVKRIDAKNGGAEGGSWCERQDAGEEPVKVGWTRGKN